MLFFLSAFVFEQVDVGLVGHVFAGQGGDASGNGKITAFGIFQCLENAFCKFPTLGLFGLGKNYGKLVAAVATNNIGLARGYF